MFAVDVDFISVPSTPLQMLLVILILSAAAALVIMFVTQLALARWVDRRHPAAEPLDPTEMLWGEMGGYVKSTFKGVDLEESKGLAAQMIEVKVGAGQPIIEQGDPATHFYVIKTGQAEVVQRNVISGEEQVIRRYGPGDSFGEVAILQRTARTASVRAVTDCVVLQLAAEDFVAAASVAASRGNDFHSIVDDYLQEDRARAAAAVGASTAPATATAPQPAPQPQPQPQPAPQPQPQPQPAPQPQAAPPQPAPAPPPAAAAPPPPPPAPPPPPPPPAGAPPEAPRPSNAPTRRPSRRRPPGS